MKHWMLAVALICFGSISFAQTAPTPTPSAPQPMVLIGNPSKLNLNAPLNTGAMLWRDLNNGMYRYGLYTDPLGISYGSVEYVELGAAQSWTAHQGYPGFGAHMGISALSVLNLVQQAATGYDLAALWKPLGTAASWVRFNADWQYLPQVPGAGGKHNAWGLGVDVNVPVSVVEGWIESGL